MRKILIHYSSSNLSFPYRTKRYYYHIELYRQIYNLCTCIQNSVTSNLELISEQVDFDERKFDILFRIRFTSYLTQY